MWGIVAIAWLAPRAVRADDDPFAVLREVDRAWTFELASGPSRALLAPVMGASHVRCRVAEVSTAGALPRSAIDCAPVAEAGDPLTAPARQRLNLVFDATGVRELRVDDPAQVAERTNAGAFTFPRVLAHRWRYDQTGADGARVAIAVHDERATLRGAPAALWIAEASYRAAPAAGSTAAPVRTAAGFAPGVGPALRCTIRDEARASTYSCLRLIADPVADAPPRPAPKPWIRITGSRAQDKSSLSAAAVVAKITTAYLPAIRRCHAELVRKKPAARGTLQLDLTVNAVGKVTEPRATAGEDRLAACVRGGMADWRFPIPQSEYGEPRNARFLIDLRFAPGSEDTH